MIEIGEDTKCCIKCGWMYKLRGNRKGNNERDRSDPRLKKSRGGKYEDER